MALTVTNSFEGGTDGTALSTSNTGGASGTAFASFAKNTGAAMTFSSTYPAQGSALGAHFSYATTTAAYGVMNFATTLGSRTSFRLWVYLPSSAVVYNPRFLEFRDSSNTLILTMFVRAADGTVYFGNNPYLASPTALPTDQLVFIQGAVTTSATAGQAKLEMEAFAGSNLSNPLWSVSNTMSVGTTTAINSVRLGTSSNSNSGPYDLYFDDFGITDTLATGFMGAVKPTPVTSFTSNITSGQVPLSVNFTDTSGGSPTSWYWDFGDGTTSTSQNPTHTFTGGGAYNVSLTTTTASGEGSATNTISAIPNTFINTFEGGTNGAQIYGTDKPSQLNSGGISGTAFDMAPFNSPVTLEFSSTMSWKGALSAQFAYTAGAAGYVGWNLAPPTATTRITAQAYVNLGTATSGPTGDDMIAFYNSSGSIALFGISSSTGYLYTPIGSTTFTPPRNQWLRIEVAVTPGTTTSNGTCDWAIYSGDNTVALASGTSSTVNLGTTAVTAVHFGAASQSYGTRTDYYDSVAASTIVASGFIGTPTAPVPSFTASPTAGSIPLTVNFTDTSTQSPTAWYWDFGDGYTSTAQNPTHIYRTTGNFTVSLTAFNANSGVTTTQANLITGLVTLPYHQTWTGATGNNWPTAFTSMTGTSSIQSNSGQQVTPSGAHASARNDITALPAISDTDVTFTFTAAASGVEQYLGVTINSDDQFGATSSAYPGTGYEVCISYAATASAGVIDIRSVTGGTETILTQLTKTFSGSVAYKLRFQRNGSTLQARTWLASVAEPSTWDVSATASTLYTGRVNLWSKNGADGVARSFNFDDLTVDSPQPYLVQANTAEYSGANLSRTITLPLVTAGDGLVLTASAFNSNTIISITDSAGATWQKARATSGLYVGAMEIWYVSSHPGSTSPLTVTVTLANTGTTDTALVIGEYSTPLTVFGYTLNDSGSTSVASQATTISSDPGNVVIAIQSRSDNATANNTPVTPDMLVGGISGSTVSNMTGWAISSGTSTTMTYNSSASTQMATLAATFAPNASVTLPYTETWTGTDGSAWPSPWSLDSTGTHGTASILSNQGHLVTPASSAYSAARIDLEGMPSIGDTEVITQLTATSSNAEQFALVAINADPTNLTTNAVTPNEIQLLIGYESPASGSYLAVFQGNTQIGSSVGITLNGGTAYSVHVKRIDGMYYARVWPSASAEPTSWAFAISMSSMPNSTTPTGVVSLLAQNGADGVQRSFLFDNLTVSQPSITLPYTETWTGSNGSSWGPNWTSVFGNGAATIQSNAGQLTAGSQSYELMHLNGMPTIGDTEVVVTVRPNSVSTMYTGVGILGDGVTNPNGGYGYSEQNGIATYINWNGPGSVMWISQTVNGTETTTNQISLGFTPTAGAAYRVRLLRYGTTIYARCWPLAATEPLGWTVVTSTVVGTPVSGKVFLQTGTDTSTFDDLSVNTSSGFAGFPYTETWTGTNGSQWPSPWTAPSGVGGGSSSLQTNAGQLVTPATGYGSVVRNMSAMPDVTDTDVVVQITAASSSVEQYVGVAINADRATVNGNGTSTNAIQVFLDFNGGLVQLFQGSTQVGGSVAKTLAGGTPYIVRVRRFAGTLYGRVWAASVPEPTAWDFTTLMTSMPNSTTPAGVVSLMAQPGGDGVSRTFTFDNLTIAIPQAMDTWTGTTGAAWPNQWLSYIGNPGTIQTNAGQLSAPTGTYVDSREDVRGLYLANTDITVTLKGSAASVEQYAAVVINSTYDNGGSWYGSNSYALEMQYNPTSASSAIAIIQVLNGTQSTLTSSTMTLDGTSAYRVRLQRVGVTLNAKVWLTTAAEPTTWNLTATIAATPVAGMVSIVTGNGSASTARTFTFDDLLINGTPALFPLPFTEIWTGTTGAAWPSYWAIPSGVGGGTTTIQAGRGYMLNGPYQNGAYAAALTGVSALEDCDAVVTIQPAITSSDQYVGIFLNNDVANTDGSGRSPQALAAIMNYASNVIQLYYGNNSNATFLANGSFTYVATTAYKLRARRNNGIFYAKVWDAGTSEPAAWTVSATISSYTLGVGQPTVFIQNGADGATNPRAFYFDDFTVSYTAGLSLRGEIKVNLTGPFVAKPVKVWNGTAWVVKPLKVWNGTAWVATKY